MGLFQKAARTTEEIAAGQPLDIPPEDVLAFGEAEWCACVAARGVAGESIVGVVVQALDDFVFH